jgi:hypothetical protein
MILFLVIGDDLSALSDKNAEFVEAACSLASVEID